tara:strand:- start:8799 stop:8993 length:195 start_codon:yes stop_codon:yes gene_type:complete
MSSLLETLKRNKLEEHMTTVTYGVDDMEITQVYHSPLKDAVEALVKRAEAVEDYIVLENEDEHR